MKIVETAGGVQFGVRVIPRASKNAVQGELGDAVKIRLCAPPVDGAANTALVEFLAERLGVPRSKVRIVAGATGRNKQIAVEGLHAAEAQARLLGG